MNTTKTMITNEILRKKYSMPCNKELINSHIFIKPRHFNQLQGPLSQRLLKKTEIHKTDVPNIEIRRLSNEIILEKNNEKVNKKHLELNNLIKILQKQNTNLKNIKSGKEDLQQKILNLKEKMRCFEKSIDKKSKESPSKPKGFFSHRTVVGKVKENEYFVGKKETQKNEFKEIPLEIAEMYLLTNENPKNSRDLNESDLENLLNNPNIQPANKRFDINQRNNSFNEQIEIATNNKDGIFRKYSADGGNKLSGLLAGDINKDQIGKINKDKIKKINEKIQKNKMNLTLDGLKQRLIKTLDGYKDKNEQLKKINHDLVKRLQIQKKCG